MLFRGGIRRGRPGFPLLSSRPGGLSIVATPLTEGLHLAVRHGNKIHMIVHEAARENVHT
jgi:hypothetical protein